jgi:hypothetical protein
LKKKLHLIILFVFVQNIIYSQQIVKPGFDPNEYRNALLINSQFMDSTYRIKSRKPLANQIFRSEIMGLDNQWDFWIDHRGVGIISIRGTAPTKDSWLANFYAAMVSAKGEVKRGDGHIFKYQLAESDKAYVHIGWLIGLSYMGEDIAAFILKNYQNGMRNFEIVGHSQGGALAMLVRSYLAYLPKPLPSDIYLKTYASAAPKPGNMAFAYDFNLVTRDGWAFRVVNPLDWVPEMPFSIQRTTDLNQVNPIAEMKKKKDKTKEVKSKNKAPWILKLYVKHIVNKLDRKTRKAQKTYSKVLGKKANLLVNKSIKGLEHPDFEESFNYMPCGSPVILQPTQAYFTQFIDGKAENAFIHHMYDPYLFLLNQNYPEKE